MSGEDAAGSVVVVGSLNLDLVARLERLPRPGRGARVVMVGSVGDDDDGRRLREVALADGIDVVGVATVAVPTGTALITVGGEAANTIVVSPNCWPISVR